MRKDYEVTGRQTKKDTPFLCRLGLHKWKEYWFGWLKYKLYPTEIDICDRCGLKRRTHYDTTETKRPKNLDIYEDIGNYENDS